jgi:hypothetical protein
MIDDIKTARLKRSNWHEKAKEENKLEWKNRIKKVGRTSQAVDQKKLG